MLKPVILSPIATPLWTVCCVLGRIVLPGDLYWQESLAADGFYAIRIESVNGNNVFCYYKDCTFWDTTHADINNKGTRTPVSKI